MGLSAFFDLLFMRTCTAQSPTSDLVTQQQLARSTTEVAIPANLNDGNILLTEHLNLDLDGKCEGATHLSLS